MKTDVITQLDSRRQTTEAFIRGRYREVYDAGLESLPSKLIGATDKGRIACAAGLRTAADGFFCEVYLDVPVEEMIASRIGSPVPRARLLEVTSLCSSSPRLSIEFLRAVAFYGFENGFEWSIFVATERLSRLLSLLAFDPLKLVPANPERVPNLEMWGSYYDTAPVVMAVHRNTIAKFDWAAPSHQWSATCTARDCPLYSSFSELRAKAARKRQAA